MNDTSQRSASRASSLCVFTRPSHSLLRDAKRGFLFAPGGERQERRKMIKKLAVVMTGVFFVLSPALGSDLLDGLVGYWPFDGDAKDYSGNRNHGATHGVSLTNDRHGNGSSAYYFGGSDYISVAANSQLNTIVDFSVSFWVKATSFHIHPEGAKWCSLICKGDSSSHNRQFGFEIGINLDDVLFVQYVGGDNIPISGFSLGEWIHLTATRQNMTASLYVNGNSHPAI